MKRAGLFRSFYWKRSIDRYRVPVRNPAGRDESERRKNVVTNNRRSRKVLVLMLTLTLCLTMMPAVCAMSVAEAAVTDAPTDSEDIPWSGKGTETDPYQISSAAELKALSDLVSEGKSFADTYFQMTDDIDLSTECGKTGFDADGNYDGTSVNEKNWRMIGNFVTYNAHNTFS